jgi:hypothetical protein
MEFVARGNNLAEFQKVVVKYYGNEYTVKFPNTTRWHSSLYAYERYTLLQPAVDEYVESKLIALRATLRPLKNKKTIKYTDLITLQEKLEDSYVTPGDLKSLDFLIKFLEPFTQVSRFFETKLYVYLHLSALGIQRSLMLSLTFML